MTPNFILKGKDINSAIVYVWKRQDKILYVGLSKVGFSRPFGGQHHIINKIDKVRDDDTFEIYYTTEPKALEEYLIKVHHSSFNISHNLQNLSRYNRQTLKASRYIIKLDAEIAAQKKAEKLKRIRALAPRMINLIEAKQRAS